MEYINVYADFNEYIKEVKSLLYCNASKEFSDNNVTYLYTNKQIDENLEHFRNSMEIHLSPYKSLLFFNDFFEEKFGNQN